MVAVGFGDRHPGDAWNFHQQGKPSKILLATPP
jgi:hypothetical protein